MRLLGAVFVAVSLSDCAGGSRPRDPTAQGPDGAAQGRRSDKYQILDAVPRDVLENPDLKSTREDYGTSGDRRVALVSNRGVGLPWPADYRPALSGWAVSRVDEGVDRDADQPRLLGVRIDCYYEKDQERAEMFRWPIVVTVLNAGGGRNGAVIGGCIVGFSPKRVGDSWAADCMEIFDP